PDNLPRITPFLYLRKIGPDGLDDAAQPVAIPVSVDPFPFLAALPGAPIAVGQVRAIALPAAFDLASGTRLAAPPPGRYAIAAVNATGQRWRIPNALAALPGGGFATAAQGAYFPVKPP